MTSALKSICDKAQPATEDENTALRTALSNNYPANFDAADIVRLVIYRRAVKAGMYGDGHWRTA